MKGGSILTHASAQLDRSEQQECGSSHEVRTNGCRRDQGTPINRPGRASFQRSPFPPKGKPPKNAMT